MIPVVLAHGALGIFDELIFILIGVVFIGMMIGAWWMTRSRKSATPAEPPAAPPPSESTETRSDHFPLA